MIHPRGKFVLIAVEEVAKISDIIHIPDKNELNRPNRGTIKAVGPLVTEVKPGDTCHFEQFDHSPAGEGLIIIREDEILAKEEV